MSIKLSLTVNRYKYWLILVCLLLVITACGDEDSPPAAPADDTPMPAPTFTLPPPAPTETPTPTPPTAVPTPTPSDFSGRWLTNIAILTLQQDGDQVTGSVAGYGDTWNYEVRGVVTRWRLQFEPTEVLGEMALVLNTTGDGFVSEDPNQFWCGVREGALPAGCGFSGRWFLESNNEAIVPFGSYADLIQSEETVTGAIYAASGEQLETLNGTVNWGKGYDFEGQGENKIASFRWYQTGTILGQKADNQDLTLCAWPEGEPRPDRCDGWLGLTAAEPPPTPEIQGRIWQLDSPLLPDAPTGWLYTMAQIEDTMHLVAIRATDGQVVKAYPATGKLALDATQRHVYVDQGEASLAAWRINPARGDLEPLNTIPLPAGPAVSPIADPETGRVFAFREGTIYIIEPVQGTIERTIPTNVRYNENLPFHRITQAAYDPVNHILYLVYQVTPEHGGVNLIVSFDLASETELERAEVSGAIAMAPVTADGTLAGMSVNRFGPVAQVTTWRWQRGSHQFTTSGWDSGLQAAIHLDPGRGHLYMSTETGLLVLDTATTTLVRNVAHPPGTLSGYDPMTDQLYFCCEGGTVQTWSAQNIETMLSPIPLRDTTPPPLPVRFLALSPAWNQDQTLFGIWQSDQTLLDYMPLTILGGLPLQGQVAGNEMTWLTGPGGLYEANVRVAALALSPNFAADQTLLASVSGRGIFRSEDGGQFWQPASLGLDTMRIHSLLLSPGFAADQTVFAAGRNNALYRSQDGGRSWQRLAVVARQAALTPEFDQDGTLLVTAGEFGDDLLLRSQDRGETWQEVGAAPGKPADGSRPLLRMLSLAPLFAKWQVAFAYRGDGTLYRTADGGQSWHSVLKTDAVIANGSPMTAQLVYAPDIETDRPLFLLAQPYYDPGWNTATGYQPSEPPPANGLLYRSTDGGQSWVLVQLPPNISPTALAISPNFSGDSLIYVGTVDGRVIPLDTKTLGASQ